MSNYISESVIAKNDEERDKFHDEYLGSGWLYRSVEKLDNGDFKITFIRERQ